MNNFQSMKIEISPNIKIEKALVTAMVEFANTHVANINADQAGDIKTCISEAFRNAVEHGFPDGYGGVISVRMQIRNKHLVTVTVKDNGVGIADIAQAQKAYFTTGGKEHAGMGFTIMESFSTKLTVRSEPGQGTDVVMTFDFRPVLKEGMTVYLSGDSTAMGIKDYNVRLSSPATVYRTPNKSDKTVLLCIDHIDGEQNVLARVKRSAIHYEEE